jgi:integrase
VARELIPAAVYEALRAVPGLRKGRTAAPEAEPVGCVPDGMIAAVLPFLSRQVAAMVQLQRLTGARPGELWAMRPCDIDMANDDLWEYRPAQHKTAHHGHDRMIPLGRRCQEIIRPFLAGRPTTAMLFSPAEAEAERLAKAHAARKTPLSCGNRPGTNRRAQPREFGPCYDKDTYRQAIRRACDRAFPPRPGIVASGPEAVASWREDHRFHPHQIRHTAATELRRRFGLEAAQVILGHRTLTVTQVYAEKNVEAARRVMSEVG